MSANTLATRNSGDVILAAFWNDIKNALAGDFVGRDVNGIPTSGNNLGSAAYPWGSIYSTQIIVGGVAIGTSSLERPAYQIVSGKKRSGSNQPAFLLPTVGPAASFRLLASSVNLVLSINGVAATLSADVNGIPITAAPSSQNTAAVSDAVAAGQASTRTWGEDGSGLGDSNGPYRPIDLTSVGTNISARVGTYQGFKVGTEYFIAYVESATRLNRAFRGFFFDSAGAPIKRTTFSNGATITLMNLGYVFADSAGTVDTIFVGTGVNNAPSYSYAAPTSPATGDYWFDQGNQVWKTWGGASWSIVTRHLVGLVVADSTNCVGARALDFFGLCRADNTIQLFRETNTLIRGNGMFERVNVAGSNISFGTSRAVWDTASNLAASTERYNAAVTASTHEYFYVTDTGETKISDMEPYWRPDLFGHYHPFNPWRCVGFSYSDASVHFASSNPGVVNIGKRTLPALGQQVSASSGNFSGGATSETPVTNLTASITTTGRLVNIALIPDGSGNNSAIGIQNPTANNATATFLLLIYRDSTLVGRANVLIAGGSASIAADLVSFLPPGAANTVDVPPAGTYTYSVKYFVGNAAHSGIVRYCKLAVWES